MSKLRTRVAGAGLLNDGYNYDRHLLPITGSGIFYSGDTGRTADAARDPRSKAVIDEDEAKAKARGVSAASGGSTNNGGRVGAQEIREVGRQLDSIALTPECMDDDVAQALFGDFEAGGFEEVLDDFCLTAAQEPGEEGEIDEEGNGKDGEDAAFDYDAHIRALIDKAERQRLGDNYDGRGVAVPKGHAAAADDMAFFSGARHVAARGDGDGDDEDSLDREFGDDADGGGEDHRRHAVEATPGVASALAPDEERALAEKFEQTLAEYDSDDVGDLDEHHDECRGDVPLEGDARLEAAFDEFLEEKQDEVFMEGTSHLRERRREGGSSYAALVGRTMVHASQLGGDVADAALGKGEDAQKVLAEADAVLAHPEMEPPPEEVLIDGKSYFSQASRNPWDCESILTTYSNLDNNPAVVGRAGGGRGRRRRGKKGGKNKKAEGGGGTGLGPEGVPEDEPVKIVLSAKTGLPLSAFEGGGGDPARGGHDGPDAAADHRFSPSDGHDGAAHPDFYDGEYDDEYGDDTYLSVNLGEARDRDESKEDKKARKAAVREARQVSRIQKKMMQEAFGEEFERRRGAGAEDDVAGKSVFRYS